jgi:hypothetical protein
MRKKNVQMSLLDIYHSVEERLENDKPELFRLLDEHLDWDEIIPDTFCRAFYKRFGRNRKYDLESFLRSLFLQRIFHYVEDSQLLNTLRFSYEMRDYCGFHKVPDASKLTRFKQDFCNHIRTVFENLVALTEPICQEMDKALADMLIFDTTGIESYVAENNPKRLGKQWSSAAVSNPQVKLQYINGRMCYAQRAAVVANGLGIVRHLELLDEDFKQAHPEMQIEKRANSPEMDKEIGDSTALKPVLLDFREKHPDFRYGTFSADSAFDSYDNYAFLMNEYQFAKVAIPFNPRRGLSAPIGFNENGTPLCPTDGRPFKPCGSANEKNRSPRLKFICPESKPEKMSNGRYTKRCKCESPCTTAKYGRIAYVQLNKNLRLYPGISRDDNEFAKIYNRRTAVERSINTLKDTLGIANRKTSNVLTTKADLFLAGIVQLLCVILAHKLHDVNLARRPRKLIA